MFFLPYTMSMNFLFFYVTWATLVLSHPPLRVEIIGTLVVRVLFYLVPSLIFFLFDILVPAAAAVFKAQGELGLPTGRKRAKVGWKQVQVMAWSLFNLTLGILLQGVIEYLFTKVFRMRSVLRVSIGLPYPWDIAKDLLCGFIVREIVTYTVHRYTLHSQNSPLAQYHWSWYHSLHAPYPLTAHYDHPIAYLPMKFLPTYVPAALFRYHMLTYILYLSAISLEETFAYSGYKTMHTSFFMGGVARRMDMHLINGGEGNYGAWGILDWICSTAGRNMIDDDSREEEVDEQEIEAVRKAIEESKKRTKEARRKIRRRVNLSSYN